MFELYIGVKGTIEVSDELREYLKLLKEFDAGIYYLIYLMDDPELSKMLSQSIKDEYNRIRASVQERYDQELLEIVEILKEMAINRKEYIDYILTKAIEI